MRPQAPCRDCEKRSVGCHGKCDKYKEFKEASEKLREDVRKEFVNTYHGSIPWLSAPTKVKKGSYRYNP